MAPVGVSHNFGAICPGGAAKKCLKYRGDGVKAMTGSQVKVRQVLHTEDDGRGMEFQG